MPVLEFGSDRSYDDRLLGSWLTGSSPAVAAVLIWVLEVVALGYLAVCARRALPLPVLAVSVLVRRLSAPSAVIDEPADNIDKQLRRRH